MNRTSWSPYAPETLQSCGSLAKNAWPEYNEKNDKPKLRNIVQNNWPVFFKCQGHENKERQEMLHGRVETKEAWQLNALWNPELDFRTEKGN